MAAPVPRSVLAVSKSIEPRGTVREPGGGAAVWLRAPSLMSPSSPTRGGLGSAVFTRRARRIILRPSIRRREPVTVVVELFRSRFVRRYHRGAARATQAVLHLRQVSPISHADKTSAP